MSIAGGGGQANEYLKSVVVSTAREMIEEERQLKEAKRVENEMQGLIVKLKDFI